MGQNGEQQVAPYRQKQTTLPETGFSGGAIKAAVVRSIEGTINACRIADEQLDGLLRQVEKASEYPPPPIESKPDAFRRRLQSTA